MASHRMTPVSEKLGYRGAFIRTLPEMLPTMMPGGRASRLAMIQLSTPITIPSKMKILCTYPALSPRNGPLPYIIQTSRGRRNMPCGLKHPSPLLTKARRNNRKAPANPHTTRAGRADQEGHPGRVKMRGGGRRAEKGDGG